MDQFDFTGGKLRYGAVEISFTPKERAVFEALARANGRPVAAEALMVNVWGASAAGSESLHRCVSTLRAKLVAHAPGNPIATIYGYGYRLNIPLANGNGESREEAAAAAAEAFRQAMELVGRRSRPELAMALKRLAQLRFSYPDFMPAHHFGAHGEILNALYHYDAPAAAGVRAMSIAAPLIAADRPSADAVCVRGFVIAVIHGNSSGFHDFRALPPFWPRSILPWVTRNAPAPSCGARRRSIAPTAIFSAMTRACAACNPDRCVSRPGSARPPFRPSSSPPH